MPSDKSPVPIGTILDGKFRITRELGRGGMAAVFEAENVDIGKRVAVKVLAAELVHSKVVNERFIREARASAAVRSPYICDVYDVGTFDDRPFLVMELLEGESLYDRMSRVRRLDVQTTLLIATQTAKGLGRAHAANIVHRDLKPENIFLTKNEDGDIVSKIVDFGLAKFYEVHNQGGEQARLTKEGALFGTPAYMSPEQAKAQGEVDHRSDLWALACIVYECLTGRTVWNVDQGVAMILAQIAGAPIPRPSRLRSDLPGDFDEWFLKALHRDPDKRFQTAKEFAESLAVALTETPGGARRVSLSSDEEGQEVDQLVSVDMMVSPPPRRAQPAGPPLPAQMGSDEVAVPLPSTLPPAAKGRGTGFAIGVLLLLSAIVVAGYGVWFYVLHPAEGGTIGGLGGGSDDDAGAGSFREAERRQPAETEPFALQIGNAQTRLTRGETAAALDLFRKAFEGSKNDAARSFLAHAEVAEENAATGRCDVTGLGRPRPFAPNEQGSSVPALALTSAGLVVSWAEMIPESRKRQALGTLLDSSLRRVQPAIALTPEGGLIQAPSLSRLGEDLVLLYWDATPTEQNVFMRRLEPTGTIASPPQKVAESEHKQTYPALAPMEDGTFWVIWTQRTDTRVYDLWARHFSAGYEPLADAVRLTSYTPAARGPSTASKSVAEVAHGFLNIAYALERNNEFVVLTLRVNLSDPLLKTGGLPAEPPEEGTEPQDRFLGQLIAVSAGAGKHNQPDIGCVEEGCFVVWDDEKAGALAAYFEGETGEVIWRRVLAETALRPSIATSPKRDAVATAWYDDGRLKLARINRQGAEPASTLARANGYQPSPGLIAGTEPKEWYLSWRDFEAARHEAFVLRAECE